MQRSDFTEFSKTDFKEISAPARRKLRQLFKTGLVFKIPSVVIFNNY